MANESLQISLRGYKLCRGVMERAHPGEADRGQEEAEAREEMLAGAEIRERGPVQEQGAIASVLPAGLL